MLTTQWLRTMKNALNSRQMRDPKTEIWVDPETGIWYQQEIQDR